MTKISRVGLDLAKSVFQVHAVDAAEQPVLKRKLKRSQVLPFFAALEPCVVALEAAGSAHHWGRELATLGHEVRLLPPAYVKPYLKRGQKNDAADAAAICEAAGRPSMRFVPVKSRDEQAILMVHKTRALLVRQRTMLINALRAHLAEFGLIAGQGTANLARLIAAFRGAPAAGLPELARSALEALVQQIAAVEASIQQAAAAILAWHKRSPASQRLATIPGVGPISASALAAAVGDVARFRSGRHLAAWLGLTPRQHSSGGKERLIGISKMGNRYLRQLLVLGATAMIRRARTSADPQWAWIRSLLARRPARLVSVALANKMARIAWAILAREQTYEARRVAA